MLPGESLLLIVAITGRALAQSARRAGLRPVVLDCFADADTRAVAEALHMVAQPDAIRFSQERLLDAAADAGPMPMVYGGGFEGRDHLLARLAQSRAVLGNRAEVVAAVRDPREFFEALDELGIPHPAVAFDPPVERDGWLVKQGGSGGGVQVRLAQAWHGEPASYFQRLHPGVPMSALFLADGSRALILGFNEQWTAPQPGLPFVYGGAVSRVDLPVAVSNAVTRAVNDLTARFGLRGLNGLDFLWHDGAWQVLELNPRPTATVELYDPDYSRGLVDAHIRACAGELPADAAPGSSRASTIVRSPIAVTVPEGLHFPAWCSDLPSAGTAMREGDPFCTVQAEAESPGVARALVLERQHHLERLIGDLLLD